MARWCFLVSENEDYVLDDRLSEAGEKLTGLLWGGGFLKV